jgi:hypothetical protein
MPTREPSQMRGIKRLERPFSVAPTTSCRWTDCGPERVKTLSHWELAKPVLPQVVTFRLRRPERQITADGIAKAQRLPTGLTPASPSSLLLNRVA